MRRRPWHLSASLRRGIVGGALLLPPVVARCEPSSVAFQLPPAPVVQQDPAAPATGYPPAVANPPAGNVVPPAVGAPDAARPSAEALPAPLVALAPLSLAQVVGLAEANSPRLRDARAEVDQRYGLMVQAGLYPNPRVDNGNPQFILGGVNSVYNVGMTQEMVVAGKLRLDQAAAREQMRQAELAFIRARFDLLTAVRRQFLTILAEQERIAVLTQLVAILRNSEQISSDLLRAGRVSETDLLLVRVERRRAEANLGSQQQQIVGDRRQLAALIGLPDFPVGQVVGDLKVRIPLLDAQPLVPEAVDQNALVSKAEAEVRRNQLLLNRAVVEPIPNITWQAGYQRTLSPDSPDQGTIGVYVNPPLWNQNQGNIRAAQAGIRQSLAQLASTRYDLINQLADAESRYRAADAVVRNYEQGVLPDARRGVELIQRGYEQGLFDILRVLQAQRALIEANIDYIQAQQNRLSAGADIAGLLQLETFP